MEDVLEVYRLPHDPRFPVVCMDESSKQMVGEVSPPIPAAPGHGRIIDHEYVRHGVAMLLVEVEPLTAQRQLFLPADDSYSSPRVWSEPRSKIKGGEQGREQSSLPALPRRGGEPRTWI